MPAPPDPARLRAEMRHRRRRLPAARRAAHARRAATLFAASPLFRRARHIAVYLPVAGEADPLPLAELAWRRGKRVYAPVVDAVHRGRLGFAPIPPDGALRPNRWGIPEPAGRPALRPPRRLDLVIVPLVAFDRRGHRLGMGAGYYDRTFAFRHRRRWRRPWLVGLAYGFQEVPRLQAHPWDVPLDAVLTEQGLRFFG